MNCIQKTKEELKNLFPFRIEMHAHTKPVSGCAEMPTSEVLQLFKNDGYNGIAITNHLFLRSDMSVEKLAEFYRSEMLKALELGDKIGIKVYIGAELRFINENNNDYLFYNYNPDDMLYICQLLGGTLAEFVKSYKTDDALLIQAHPFRDNMIREFDEYLDGYEVFNMHPNHNSRVALAEKVFADNGKVCLMGTDFHHLGYDNLCSTRTPVLPANTSELIELIKENDYIFEIGKKLLI